ncbi:hypothetical protein [Flavobacterium sp. HTF]|uniref:hypothetical protein n=1 Tax=Flavobacterium sp. HTF TaxID=2170732 RepID=UPI000D5F052D|nr:hypothetical protein [Flavobacterium sp. HTF]PWB22853.1 hypothetical protein DCO46_16140 [Flavobacterium sp. HTF]
MRLILILAVTFLNFTNLSGQETIRLERKPKVILHSWYPEFKEFPKLNIAESKILFTVIPDFKNLIIRDNDINLKAINGEVEIKETDKPNQYLVKVKKADSKFIEFELWFDLGNYIILLKKNSQWIDVRKIYPYKENRIMLQTIKLQITN